MEVRNEALTKGALSGGCCDVPGDRQPQICRSLEPHSGHHAEQLIDEPGVLLGSEEDGWQLVNDVRDTDVEGGAWAHVSLPAVGSATLR